MGQRHPLQRDTFARESSWHDRSFLDIQDHRFSNPNTIQQPIHPRCLPVETALKDCAGLSVREFALIVLDEDGQHKTYTSTSLTRFQQRIFSERFKNDFKRTIQQSTQGTYASPAYSQEGGIYSDFDGDSDPRSRHSASGESHSDGGGMNSRFQRQSKSEETEGDSGSGPNSRKRRRPADNDETPVPVPVIRTQQLVIGNDEEVDKFYHVRFKDMQQSSCKMMGKAFVKLIEPKKQTHHPYTKGAAMAPPWWPPTSGENAVRHREPDHLYKPERIQLLVHILKLIVEPVNKQCSSVQKLQLNVKKLEEVTMKALSPWFSDPDHPDNAHKKVYLKEIFKVAKAQERYKNGEIDGTTRVPVQFGDRSGLENSDDEDDEDEGIKDEDDDSEHMIHTPDSISPTMLQGQTMQHQQSQQDTDFFRNRQIPVRFNPHQQQPQLDEHESYSDNFLPRSMSLSFQHMGPTPLQEPRRPFPSPTFPASPQHQQQQQQQSLYGWQNSMATNAPPQSQSQFYVTSPQSALQPQPLAIPYQLPPPTVNMLPPMSAHTHPHQGQHQTQGHYGDAQTQRYDSGPALGSQVRTGSLGHPHHIPHGFADYIPEGTYGPGPGEGDMKHEHGGQNMTGS